MTDHKEIQEAIAHSENFEPTQEWLEKLASRVQMTEWLRQLLDENERLKGAVDDMFQNREKWRESHMLLEQENAQLQADKAAAVEALRWYVEKSDSYVTSYGCQPCGISKRARAALERLEGGPKVSDTTE